MTASHAADEPHVHVLRATKLGKDYDDLWALRDVHLTFEAGRLVALVGRNGAGKSTFLGIAAGLIEPSEGQVVVGGHVAGTLPARALLAYAGDNPVLYDDLSVWEHLEYVAGLHGIGGWQPRARHLLDVFDLAERAGDLPARFSRGMRQKAALCAALVRSPRVLLVDEPFVGLDVPAQQALVEELVACAHAGRAVIVATHQTGFLARVDRCVVLRDGHVVHDGAPNDEILASLRGADDG